MRLDHTLVCTSNMEDTIVFYRDVLGLEHRGRSGRFEVVAVDDHLVLDFVESNDCRPRHFAFSMAGPEFEEVFRRLREAGHAYGDGPGDPDNMRGPGRSTGARGVTTSVYFRDPNGHLLEIVTYDSPSAGR